MHGAQQLCNGRTIMPFTSPADNPNYLRTLASACIAGGHRQITVLSVSCRTGNYVSDAIGGCDRNRARRRLARRRAAAEAMSASAPRWTE